MKLWYIDKKISKNKKETFISFLFGLILPIGVASLSKLTLYYFEGPKKLISIIPNILLILIVSLFITTKFFSKKKPAHVFIKDIDGNIIYLYLYNKGFNKFTLNKFYLDTKNMEYNLTHEDKLPSTLYDIATKKIPYNDYGILINKVYEIESYLDYYEVYLSTPKNKIFKDELIAVPKYLNDIDTLLEELNKLKDTKN